MRLNVARVHRVGLDFLSQGAHEHAQGSEVGLFLGYPSEDVNGFISCGAKGAKCVGTWKVYGDVAAARRTFALYRKCTRIYREAYGRHRSLEKLTVGRLQRQ